MIKKLLLKIEFVKNIVIRRHNYISVPKHCKILFNVHGRNNNIVISKTTKIQNCRITIYGNNQTIKIGDNNLFVDTSFWLEDDNSRIIVGNNNSFCGKIDMSVIEGKQILFGNNCLVSRNVSIVNGDSHSILDSDGNRINKSGSIRIGNHVWIGKNVNILKRGSIGDNSVIGANSLITKNFSGDNNCVIAGSPAKIIKRDINWTEKRV